MAVQFLKLGFGPLREKHVEAGSQDYQYKASRELIAFRNQLLRKFGQPPPGAALSERFTEHSSGMCYELVVYYEDRSRHATEWAHTVHDNLPYFWDEDARKELGIVQDEKPVVEPIGNQRPQLVYRINEILGKENPPSPEEVEELSALANELAKYENAGNAARTQKRYLKRADTPPPRIVTDDEMVD